MSNTPSDAEIMDVARPFITRVGSHWENDDAIPDNGRIEEFARAVLAKWGAPQPVVREPLTDGQAKEVLWNEHLRWMNAAGLDTEGMRPTGEWLDHWLFYVRAIERAHGITQKGGS